MIALDSQRKLVEDITSPVIIFAGGYGSGKNTALALKALAHRTSIVVDLDESMIKNVNFPYFDEILQGVPYTKTKMTIQLKNTFNFTYFSWYDKIDLIGHGPVDVICFNNFEIVDEEQSRKLYEIARAISSQVVLSVFPFDLSENHFVRKLAKTEKVITVSSQENPHIPEGFEIDIKKYYKPEFAERILSGSF